MTLYSCILFWSMMNNIDHRITIAVIQVESNGNPMAVSPDKKDSGLMQIRVKYVPETMLQLFNPCTNVKRGTKLLAEAKRRCRHKLDNTWLTCYNMGHTGAARLKFPKKFPYYVKVMSQLNEKK